MVKTVKIEKMMTVGEFLVLTARKISDSSPSDLSLVILSEGGGVAEVGYSRCCCWL